MNATAYIRTGRVARHTKDHSSVAPIARLANYFYLNYLTNYTKQKQGVNTAEKELENSGLSKFQLDRRESKHIAMYLQMGEHIEAAVRGHIYGIGGILMVVTDSRVLYLHDIPLFSNFEEFSYEVVNGISINRAGVLSSISLFSKFKTYRLDYVNSRQAERFVRYVESRIYLHGLRQLSVQESQSRI